ncbi:Hypothetical protein NTJ_10590 [Nesidiocoris tenuis]|uniref:Uncharacterized protein n=1 Tax=Nesidiocoris tenuis TaxID=355587 RepID=A0ABN7B032_9HEMI|nr:Hypothetical protein NTJ_10590 [Nesidiocoris tenuis]
MTAIFRAIGVEGIFIPSFLFLVGDQVAFSWNDKTKAKDLVTAVDPLEMVEIVAAGVRLCATQQTGNCGGMRGRYCEWRERQISPEGAICGGSRLLTAPPLLYRFERHSFSIVP